MIPHVMMFVCECGYEAEPNTVRYEDDEVTLIISGRCKQGHTAEKEFYVSSYSETVSKETYAVEEPEDAEQDGGEGGENSILT